MKLPYIVNYYCILFDHSFLRKKSERFIKIVKQIFFNIFTFLNYLIIFEELINYFFIAKIK